MDIRQHNGKMLVRYTEISKLLQTNIPAHKSVSSDFEMSHFLNDWDLRILRLKILVKNKPESLSSALGRR